MSQRDLERVRVQDQLAQRHIGQQVARVRAARAVVLVQRQLLQVRLLRQQDDPLRCLRDGLLEQRDDVDGVVLQPLEQVLVVADEMLRVHIEQKLVYEHVVPQLLSVDEVGVQPELQDEVLERLDDF